MKKLILVIDDIRWERAFELCWFVMYVANSSFIWFGWIFMDTRSELYETLLTFNVFAALLIGFLGILTCLFPFVIIYIVWEKLVQWARSRHGETQL
jgi:hypothetical protein